MVTEELKQRITAKAGKCKRDKTRVAQYRQNKLFHCNQKDDARNHRQRMLGNFWSEIWVKPVQYKENADWLVKVEKELEVVKIQNRIVITKEDVIEQIRKMPN